MELRFYIDSETQQPHIWEHSVSKTEVHEVLIARGDDFQGQRSARIKFGQTKSGRYLKVIYVPDEDRDSVFVITAHELTPKELRAFRRRRRKRR